MPSCGEYKNWNDCISKNRDKEDPDAYCGKIKHQTEDFDASKCVFKRMDCLEQKYPNMFDLRTKLTMAYDYCNSDLKERQDFGNGLFFVYVEDLVGKTTLKKLLDYQKVKSIWNDIRIIQSPILINKEDGIGRIGKLYLKKFQNDFLTEDASNDPNDPNKLLGQKEGNMPLEPVMSSTVMARGVVDNKLYVRFHSSPSNTYKYEFESNQDALQTAEEMVNESPGRWVWENLRGHQAGTPVTPAKLGQAWGSKNLTIGGIGSLGYAGHPYEKIGLVIQKIDEVPGMEEIAKKLRKFKTEVKAKGEGATSAEPIKLEELKEYQEEIYKEKEKRKVINEEVKGMIEKLRSKVLNRDMVIEDSDYPKSKGRWVTIKGRRIFIPEGQELQFEKDGTFKVSEGKEVKSRDIEIDIWIDKGYEKEFEKELAKQDVKHIEFLEKIQEDADSIRYAINYRAFSKIKIPKGNHWQLKNVFGEWEEKEQDFLVEDSMNKLVQWVLAKKLTTDPNEAEEIAFAIANSNKKSKNKAKVESQKSTLQEVGESYSKSQEKEWESTWSEIGESFQKQREERKSLKEKEIRQKLIDKLKKEEWYGSALAHLGSEMSLEQVLDRLEKIKKIFPDFKGKKGDIFVYNELKKISNKEIHDLEEFPKKLYHVTTKSRAKKILESPEDIKELYFSTEPYWQYTNKHCEEEGDDPACLVLNLENYDPDVGLSFELEYMNKYHPEWVATNISPEFLEEYKEEEESLGFTKGKGWFGESERHSKARKEGHADLSEASLLEDISDLLVELNKYDFKLDDNIEELKDFLKTNDMKLNLNPSELKLILNQLQNVDIDDKYFSTVASSIVNKINKQFTGKFSTVEEEATSFIINRTQNKLKGILYSFYDIYTDIVALPSEIQEVFSQDIDAIAEDPHYDNVFSLIHDRIESDEVIEFKDEKEKSEWDKKFDSFIDNQELNGFIDFLIDNLHKIGSQENEDWKEAVKEELETNKTGTGKGWWGESLRHSKARSTGKADLIEKEVKIING